jgi:hypothetical protein
MVRSQTASLTPGPSFAHNLGDRCPNGRCEAIFDIYAPRPFPMTPRTPQCEVSWALLSNPKHSGVPEDSKSPTLGMLGFTPTLGQSGVATVGGGVGARSLAHNTLRGRGACWSFGMGLGRVDKLHLLTRACTQPTQGG